MTCASIPLRRSTTLSQRREKPLPSIPISQQRPNLRPWISSSMIWISQRLARKTRMGMCASFALFLDVHGSFRNRHPWFDTLQSYNPAIHRVKQALFHCAVVSDLSTNPLPPPHPELLKYFEPPRRVLKRARDAIEECKVAFKVKQGICKTLDHEEQLHITPSHQSPRKSQGHEKMGTPTPKMTMTPCSSLTEKIQTKVHVVTELKSHKHPHLLQSHQSKSSNSQT